MMNRSMNFIPLENREKFVIPHKIFPMMIAPAVFLYIAVSFFLVNHHRNLALADTVALETSHHELLAHMKNNNISAQDIEDAKALRTTVKQKNNWSESFKELSRLIPDGVWLTSFGNAPKKMTAAAGMERLILKGESGSQEEIALFLAALEKSHYFSDVQLMSSEKQEDIEPARYQFQFSISRRAL